MRHNDFNSSFVGDSLLEEADQIELIDQLFQEENWKNKEEEEKKDTNDK